MNMFYWAQFPLYHMVYNKQLMLVEPKVHCTLPFCIVPSSVHLVGSAVVENDLVLESDGA